LVQPVFTVIFESGTSRIRGRCVGQSARIFGGREDLGLSQDRIWDKLCYHEVEC